jgi:hypothetical protein
MSQLSSHFSAPMQGAPRLEPSETGIGPGPLSPIWQTPQITEAPTKNQWVALAEEFSALRRGCHLSLREETPGGQLLLSLSERDDLNAKLARLKAASLTELSAWHRSSAIVGWPDPVLPSRALWGARDLADLLAVAIRGAATLSERTRRTETQP